MPFFDELGKKISEKAQDVVRGTKELTDTARLKSMIADEQRQITDLYAQIGKLYFEMSEHTPETPIGQLCLSVTYAKGRIANHEESIRQVKGVKRCTSCSSDVPLTSVFCGKCGTKVAIEVVPVPETNVQEPPAVEMKYCTECGSEIENGLAFCTSCGQKIDSAGGEA